MAKLSIGNHGQSALAGRESTMTKYLTTDEVAELLRTPVESVRYWRHVNKGPKSFKVGRRVLYALDDVEAFISEARQSAVGSSAA